MSPVLASVVLTMVARLPMVSSCIALQLAPLVAMLGPSPCPSSFQPRQLLMARMVAERGPSRSHSSCQSLPYSDRGVCTLMSARSRHWLVLVDRKRHESTTRPSKKERRRRRRRRVLAQRGSHEDLYVRYFCRIAHDRRSNPMECTLRRVYQKVNPTLLSCLSRKGSWGNSRLAGALHSEYFERRIGSVCHGLQRAIVDRLLGIAFFM